MANEMTAGTNGPVTTSLSVDTSAWERGLDKARAKLFDFSNQMEKKMAKTSEAIKNKPDQSGEALKTLSDGLVGGLAGGGLVGILSKVGETGAKALKEIAVGYDKANERALQLSRTSSEIADRFERKQRDDADRFSALTDPSEKMKELGRQIEQDTEKLRALKDTGTEVAQVLDESNSVFSKDGWNWFVTGKFDATQEKLKSGQRDMLALETALNKKLLDNKEALEKMADASKNKAFIGELARFVDDLDTKTKTIDMSPLEAQVEGIRKKFNGTGKSIEEALAKARDFDQLVKQREVNKSFEEELKSLEMIGQQIGKNANEIKLMEYAAKGFNADQLNRLEAQLKGNAARKLAYEPPKRVDAMLAGSKESAAAIINGTGKRGREDAQVKIAKNTDETVKGLATIHNDFTLMLESQKRAESLLREFNAKNGDADELFAVDG